MQLDYQEGVFLLRGVPPSEHRMMLIDHGFDYSTAIKAYFTREPYAALTFYDHATPAAGGELRVLQEELAASRALDSDRHISCPSSEELSGYQKASVAYALHRTNALIADQPGLGKTAEAVCYLNELQAERALIVCPAVVRQQWEDEIRRWTMHRWPYTIHRIMNSKHGVINANFTIVSYDLLRKDGIGGELAKLRFDVGVFDEAHMLKSSRAGRTRAIFGGGEDRAFGAIAERCERLLALSGTPIPNRPREAYMLARGLCFDAIDWLSEERFTERFNPSELRTGTRADGSTYTYTDERSGRHAELGNRLRANFMARHLKRDVLPQLKLPVYDLVRVEETGPVRAAIAAERLLDIDPETHMPKAKDAEALGAIATVRREMGEALAPQVAVYAKYLLESIEKLVIFGHHKTVLDIIERNLAGKYGLVRVDGSTSMAGRARAVELFQHPGKPRVFLGNALAAGVGLDGLQHATDTVLMAEAFWTPKDNEQAIARVDRRGQKRTVLALFFVAPGSFSERILATSLDKGHVLLKTLDRN